jgi:hypothetical protein
MTEETLNKTLPTPVAEVNIAIALGVARIFKTPAYIQGAPPNNSKNAAIRIKLKLSISGWVTDTHQAIFKNERSKK